MSHLLYALLDYKSKYFFNHRIVVSLFVYSQQQIDKIKTNKIKQLNNRTSFSV